MNGWFASLFLILSVALAALEPRLLALSTPLWEVALAVALICSAVLGVTSVMGRLICDERVATLATVSYLTLVASFIWSGLTTVFFLGPSPPLWSSTTLTALLFGGAWLYYLSSGSELDSRRGRGSAQSPVV